MRERFCRVCSGWHNIEAWPHNCMRERSLAQSDLPAPHFISDAIEIQSMHDGNMYTSKSRLRAEYRAHGVEEIGNEKPKPVETPKTDRKAIREELKRVYSEHTA